jgi:DNA-binding MarR family transcriptional regulator
MKISSQQVCQDLLALIGRVKSSMSEAAEHYDLTIMQVHTLYAISQGAITMGKVAENLHTDASNVTGIVDRLVATGLITRQEGAHDRRTKTLQLTDKGRSAIESIYAALPSSLGCARLTEHERELLHGLVSKLTATAPADSKA